MPVLQQPLVCRDANLLILVVQQRRQLHRRARERTLAQLFHRRQAVRVAWRRSDLSYHRQGRRVLEAQAGPGGVKTHRRILVRVQRLNLGHTHPADALPHQADALRVGAGGTDHSRQLAQLPLVKDRMVRQVQVRHELDEVVRAGGELRGRV